MNAFQSPSRLRSRKLVLRAVATVALLSALPATTSCRQILGIEQRKLKVETVDSGVKQTKTKACGFEQPSADCADCVSARCCDEAKTCEADPACKAAYQCVLGCKAGDADCATWCLGSYSRPDTLAKLTACSSTSCSAECDIGCGMLVNGSSTCDQCVRSSCCDENLACSSDEACVNIDLCSHRCLPAGSARCATACAMTYSSGSDKAAARSACISANCADACSTDNGWGCLERRPPALKPPSLEPITFTMTVVEFLSEMPYEGLTVKACASGDPDCIAPLATTTTDASGSFTITVPPGSNGFNGYVDLQGGTLYPTLYYFFPPVIVGGNRGRLRLPSTATINVLSMGIGVTLDDTRGHLAMVPWDCTMSPAAGVSLTINAVDPQSTTFYFQNGLPSHAATQTASEPALGGAVNIQPGVTQVRAKVESLGTISAQYTLNVRKGTLTAGSIPPTP